MTDRPRTVLDAVATESIQAGDHVQFVIDPATGKATVRRASLVCGWCPVYAHPDPAFHPGGQQSHVEGR